MNFDDLNALQNIYSVNGDIEESDLISTNIDNDNDDQNELEEPDEYHRLLSYTYDSVYNNNGTSNPSITSNISKNSSESQFFEFIFFLCSILDFFVVQPMIFFTSEDNIYLLPFYFS